MGMGKQKQCRDCRERVAVVGNVLCQMCFDARAAKVREVMGEDAGSLSDDDVYHLVLSFFVGW